jgi:signal transduction histidine kinase/ActR/RegA family two-component response regulator
MERLIGVVQELSTARTLAHVQAIVRTAARSLTNADGATFVLRDGDDCFYADEDAIAPLWKGHRFPLSRCVSGWAMLNRRAVVIPDIYSDERIPQDAYRPTFVRSLAMVPIRTSAPIGAIGNYWASPYVPTDAQLRLLQALADSTSIALENAQLFGQLETRIRDCTEALEAAARAEREARSELAERKRAEEALRLTEHQLRQSQKMEAVGQLAGGVAHDFNNILCVILSYSSMSLSELPPDHPLRDGLNEIYKAGERAASLTRQLLALSRHQMLAPTVVNVNETVEGLQRMLERLLGEGIQLRAVLAAAPHPVIADPGQIEQVLLNLVVNARDAMPRGGTILIETQNVQLAGGYAPWQMEVAEGDYVMLAVSDTGIGMDKETQTRVFEPFFTTKEKGRGTGLGLSTVYGIVRQSGGHIWLYSELGKGTTFKVYLPRCPEGVALDARRTASPTSVGGDETVLLVEDDSQVRAAAREVLVRAGYGVIEVSSAEEALAKGRQPSPTIHLLLTDLVMPRTSGVQLARDFVALRPGVVVLCMSGYTDEAVVQHGLIDSGLTFLQKPFTPNDLLLKVRQVLNAALTPASTA